MRTTVNIQDDLLRRAKRVALDSQSTLGEVIDQALRTSLDQRQTRAKRKQTRLPTFHGQGMQAGVELDDSAALLDRMEGR